MFEFFDFEFNLVNQEFTQMQQLQKNWLHNTDSESAQKTAQKTFSPKNSNFQVFYYIFREKSIFQRCCIFFSE
jgi:hypothetical protein